MNTYQKNEQKVREMINVHKELYFNIEATDDNFEDKINESFNSLKNIQDFINKRLKIETKPLLARVYISNRNKIREVWHFSPYIQKKKLLHIFPNRQSNQNRLFLPF